MVVALRRAAVVVRPTGARRGEGGEAARETSGRQPRSAGRRRRALADARRYDWRRIFSLEQELCECESISGRAASLRRLSFFYGCILR